jgi:hypothetical protein
MKKRLLTGLIAGGLMAAMLPGVASAVTNGGGNSGDAPGLQQAVENCGNVISRQHDRSLQTKNKNKSDVPVNCDHFYN